jgi:hypothetical protein
MLRIGQFLSGLLLFWSLALPADNSSIKGLLEDIEKAVQTGNHQAIKELIYPLGPESQSNREWILRGIEHPTQNRSNDNGFNIQALRKILKHSHRFQPVSQSIHFSEIQDSFTRLFTKTTASESFLNDLKKGGKNIFILEYPETRSMILIYRISGEYQLVWWKEMIRVADHL